MNAMHVVGVGLILVATLGTARAQERFHWVTNQDNTITIISYRLGEAEVTVPETITGLPVTHLGTQAFYRSTAVKKVTLPNTLKGIGYAAFQYAGLTNINFPPGLEKIDGYAFDGTWLQTADLPASVGELGESPFFRCHGLVAINIDPSNTTLSSLNGVLFNKAQTRLLEYPAGRPGDYTVPETVEEIVNRAFQGANELTKVAIPGSAKTIGYYAFYSCEKLSEVVLEEGITALGDQAFGECIRLASARLPTTLQSIGNLCFTGCIGMTQLTLPTGLTTLGGWNVFNNCRELTSVTIPGTVKHAGSGTFIFCTNLTTATLEEGVVTTDSTFQECSKLSSVTLPSSLANLGDNTFKGCRSLGSLNIPNNTTNIGWYAFDQCHSLRSVIWPSELLNVGRGAFRESGLITANLPAKVVQVEGNAFENCPELSSIQIPAATTLLGGSVLRNCASLQTIDVASENPNYSSVNGVLFDKGQTKLIQFPIGRSGSYIVPASVTTIDYYAFSGAKKLEWVILPEGLLEIRGNAFNNCTGLTTMKIPSTVVTLADYSFNQCTNLTGILFSGNAPAMSWAATYGCNNVTYCYQIGTSGWNPPPSGVAPVEWNPVVSSCGPTAEGFTLRIGGNANIPVRVETGSDMQYDWRLLQDTQLTNGQSQVTDTKSKEYPYRFYRLVWPR